MLAGSLAAWLALASASAPGWVEIVTGDAPPDEPLPLVLALHGRGADAERMKYVVTNLSTPARVIIPRGPLSSPGGRAWFEPRLRSGGPELAEAVLDASQQLAELVDDVRATRPTCGRTTLVGFSQGGAIALAYAARHPHEVGVVIPMAAWVPPPLAPGPEVEVTALHGNKDRTIPIRWVRRMVDTLNDAGGHATLVTHRGVAHYTTQQMRRRARQMLRAAIALEAAGPDCTGELNTSAPSRTK
jgi:phospholipase/carboxylesterase